MNIPYLFRLTVQSLWGEKWINILAVLTIAGGLFIFSIGALILYNLEIATNKLPEKFSIIAYLNDDLPEESLKNMMNSLQSRGIVKSMRLISKEEALQELKTVLRSSGDILEGLNSNPLPRSLEIKLRGDAAGPDTVRSLSREIAGMSGIEDVIYGDALLTLMHSFTTGVKTLGVIVLSLLGAGVVFICYSTVKILFYRKSEELETYKLLGATPGFIKAPFLLEGAVIGAGGGILGFAGIISFHSLVIVEFSSQIPFLSTVLFPVALFILLPVVGLLLGFTGAAIALGRIRYQ